MPYDGQRFRAECRLAGKIFGARFGVDVGLADPMYGEPDVVVGDDALAFAGIAPPRLRLYPIETHLAEKLHAYTMPRSRPNSRVEDLPDLALLATANSLDADRVLAALVQTFEFRATHPIPSSLPAPPSEWSTAYAAMALEDELPWPTLRAVFDAASAFLDPVLARTAVEVWSPTRWCWIRRSET